VNVLNFFGFPMKKIFVLLLALIWVACSDVAGDYEAEYGELFPEYGEADSPSGGDGGNVSSSNGGGNGTSSAVESSSSNIKSESEHVSKFNSKIQYRTLVDNRDNKAYKTVVIGNQLWMAENLNFADTICIPELKKGSDCYDGNSKNCKYYGRLYNFYAAVETCSDSSTSEIQGVCPDNWHLPMSSEWNELIAFVKASVGGDRAGNSLKSLEGWALNSNGAEGSDDFGFRILPGGLRNDYGKFVEQGNHGAFWASNASVGSAATYELTTASVYGKKNTYVASLMDNRQYYEDFLSIRCISDSLVCEGVPYDSHKMFCTEGSLYPLCGGKNFDPAVYTCYKDSVVKIADTSKFRTHRLCSGELYDPTVYACEGNRILPLCGETAYDANVDFCGEDMTAHNLCGKKTYDVRNEFCSSETIYDLCGGTAYDPGTYACVGNVVRKKCGNTTYDSTTHFCADNKQVYEIKHFTYGTLKDVRDGKTYKTITIANQTWMAENLRYNAENSVCDSCDVYGRFYKWADDGYCPIGWHIPSRDEWVELIEAVGGSSIAGFYLKSVDGWSGGGGIDSFGFNALASGYRYYIDSSPRDRDSSTSFWTTGTCQNLAGGVDLYLSAVGDGATFGCSIKSYYYNPVRCVKDPEFMCGSTKYDPTVKFCVEGEQFSLCNGEEYDVTTYTCVEGATRPLCGTLPYDPMNQFCTEDLEVYELCGGETYDVVGSFCYSQKAYPKCNGETYDPEQKICDGDILKDLCGGKVYTPGDDVQCQDGILFNLFTDSRDGKRYKTVSIDTFTVMAENLDFADSVLAPNIEGRTSCYNGKLDSCEVFGRLYTWTAAMNVAPSYVAEKYNASEKHQGICPSGWHVPSVSEWNDLYAFVSKKNSKTPYNDLKSKARWATAGTNLYGFSVLPGGWYSVSLGRYEQVGGGAAFWFTDEYAGGSGNFVKIQNSGITSDISSKWEQYSLRCFKD